MTDSLHSYITTLPNIPMQEGTRVCQNPYWHDLYSSGQGLIENGRYEIMHGNLQRLDSDRESVREYLIIVDRRTGRRLKVDLNVFKDVEDSAWESERSPD